MNKEAHQRFLAILGVLLAASLACSLGRSATPMTNGPTVTLTSPQPGQVAPVGEQILVHSTSEDTDGVQRVELWVDDELIRADTNPDVNSPYIVSQPWQSNSVGTHIILVKAFNAQGAEGQTEPIAITLEEKAQPLPESTPVAGVALTPGREESRPTSAVSTGTPTPPLLHPRKPARTRLHLSWSARLRSARPVKCFTAQRSALATVALNARRRL